MPCRRAWPTGWRDERGGKTMLSRRTLLQSATAATAAIGMPAIAAGPTAVRVGFLHSIPADGHLWTAEHLGSFNEQGLALETILFVTGLEAFQALAGGSVDLVTTGAVISNFPARGVGKAFLINDEQFGSAQLWVHPASGIRSVADLKGKQVATTRSTTAHYFLYRALQHNGLDTVNDIEIVHQQMGNAVTAFIAGAVPAVATWIPFDAAIAKSSPDAVMLANARQYPDASILNGWSASNELYATDKDLLRRFIRAWLPANEALATRPAEILPVLQAGRYKELTLAQLQSEYDATRWHQAEGWVQAYRDGEVARILNNVTAFNVAMGAFADPLPAETYFDGSLFLDVVAQG
jgi:NitT/TauT family transport system substrate-binding protein